MKLEFELSLGSEELEKNDILQILPPAKSQWFLCKHHLFCESLKHLQISHAMKTEPTPDSLPLPTEKTFTEYIETRRKILCDSVEFVPAMCDDFFFFASTSFKLLCCSSHLKSELLCCCTLRREGIFQDKAGHCSHFYSLITLRLLHSQSIALKHFGAANMILTLWQYKLWHHS